DSIYGISCDATNEEAVQKIIDLKGRSADKSFIVLINSDRMINQCFKDIPEVVWDMIDFSESPLTIVMEGGQYVAPKVLNPDGSLGMRSIKSGSINDILRRFNKPIVSTSPNFSGESTPMNFNEINEGIKSAVDFVFPDFLDDKMSGQPSKIIRIKPNGEVKILRK
ncbi:MAG: Sua5/YciO/YrdC/YwlC family protein, partial [Vicingaceae bacterium]